MAYLPVVSADKGLDGMPLDVIDLFGGASLFQLDDDDVVVVIIVRPR